MISVFQRKLILAAFFCFAQVCDCASPELSLGEEHVFEVVPHDDDTSTIHPFVITCWGETKLSWSTEVSKEFYTVDGNVTNGRHYSTLQIAEPIYADTGYYNCSDAWSRTATSFVYMKDPTKPFVNSLQPLTGVGVRPGIPFRLNCQTTSSNINVHLVKGVEKQKLNPSDYTFDPRRGVIWHGETLDGLIECRNNLTDESLLFLLTREESRARHSPSISKPRNSHFVAGHDFALYCNIPFNKKQDRYPDFRWDTPRMKDIMFHERKTFTNIAQSKLLVRNATLKDSGAYVCTVKQGTNSRDDKIHIAIKDHIHPYVKFNISDNNILKPSLEEGMPFDWVLYFRGFPDTLKYEFFDPFKNPIVESEDKVSIMYDYEDGLIRFLKKKIRAEDFGEYVAKLTTQSGEEDRTYVLLQVNATPKIEFETIPSLFQIGSNVSLTTLILAFDQRNPYPNVDWYLYTDCPEGLGTCNLTNGMLLSNYSLSKGEGPQNRFESSVMFIANTSGVINSTVENNFGSNYTSADLIVGDKPNRQSVTVISEKGETYFWRGNSTSELTVIEGDDVTMECFALDFVYRDLQFMANDSSMESYNCNTDLSSGRCFRIDSMTSEFEGEYSCGAINRRSEEEDRITYSLKFVEKMAPRLKEGSNVSKEGTMLYVTASEDFKINCLVDGMPTPTITWYKDGEDIENIPNYLDGKKVLLEKNRQVLEVKFAESEHEGRYECQVKNRVGGIEPFTTITVQGAGLTTLHLFLISLAVVCIVILYCVVVGLVFRVKKEGQLRDELRRNQLYLFEKGKVCDLNMECTIDEQADLLPYDPNYEVEKNKIKLGKVLGAGAFGRVMQADVEGLEKEGEKTRVAVKMCKDGTDMAQLRSLTLELKIMIHLGKHLNIVNLMGAYTENIKMGDLWILVEYCKYGNLLKFIQKCRARFHNQIDPITGTIDHMSMGSSAYGSMSPGAYGSSNRGYSRGLSETADGYLEPRHMSGSMKGSFRPLVRKASNISHSGSMSGTMRSLGRTPSSASQTGPVPSSFRPGMYVGNPHYATVGTLEKTSENDIAGSSIPESEELSTPALEVSSQQYKNLESVSPPPTLCRNTSVVSNPASEIGNYVNTNTDITGLSSPPPFSPSSSSSGDFFFDSQGNQVPFDLRSVPGISCPLTTTDLVCWGWQVANGMEYLTKRKVLHGDLAARNLLLAENNVVKISDFGLSRDVYKSDVYMKKGDDIMPIKWMAPEAIQRKIFTIQSDVWAYGVTLWELFTLGNNPYPGVPLNQDFPIALENGMRLDKPKYTTDELYRLMCECWNYEPTERPGFSTISDHLSEMLPLEIKESYEAMNTIHMQNNEEWLKSKEDYLAMFPSPDFQTFQAAMEGPTDPAYLSMPGAGDLDVTQESTSGYLDMKSVRSSDTIFSPRPRSSDIDGPSSIFNFSTLENSLANGQRSPGETTNLLKPSDENVKSPVLPQENQNYLNLSTFKTEPSNVQLDMGSKQDSHVLYKNLETFAQNNKQNTVESCVDDEIISGHLNSNELNNYANLKGPL